MIHALNLGLVGPERKFSGGKGITHLNFFWSWCEVVLLLISRNRGADFEIAYTHGWKIAACPMSSAFLSETKTGMLAAAETHGKVFFVRVDSVTGKVSSPVSPETKGKHPVAVGNAKGEVLLAWTEGPSWGKGGAVAWQLYDSSNNPLPENGKGEGVPAWSLATMIAKPDGDFVVIY